MNKLLTTITLLCFSVGAIAQDNRNVVFACQQEVGSGLFWKNNRWETAGVNPTTLLLTIPNILPQLTPIIRGENEIINNRNNATFKLGAGDEDGIFCRLNTSRTVSCVSRIGSDFLFLDLDNGRLGYTALLGATSLNDDYRDSVVNLIYNCTKF